MLVLSASSKDSLFTRNSFSQVWEFEHTHATKVCAGHLVYSAPRSGFRSPSARPCWCIANPHNCGKKKLSVGVTRSAKFIDEECNGFCITCAQKVWRSPCPLGTTLFLSLLGPDKASCFRRQKHALAPQNECEMYRDITCSGNHLATRSADETLEQCRGTVAMRGMNLQFIHVIFSFSHRYPSLCQNQASLLLKSTWYASASECIGCIA
jgi:hypothetical protein